jgi:hypothetical protein
MSLIHEAAEVGHRNGTNASAWVTINNGNVTTILDGIDNGKTNVIDAMLPKPFMGDYTEERLAQELNCTKNDTEVFDAYRESFTEAVKAGVRTRAEGMLGTMGEDYDQTQGRTTGKTTT